LFFLTRSRKRSLKHLEWRVRLFGAGALLALVGISVQLPWLIYSAIVVLVAGMGLRLLEEPLEADGDSDSHVDEIEDESEGDPGAL
jgi:hypothetical protein